MDNDNPFAPHTPTPTAARPLLGLTVLVIEDSRFACEAMRLLCLRSGARIRRADCIRSARRHLQVYRPSVVIIDLGLPDGNGLDLVTELSGKEAAVGLVIATSGDTERETDALAAGADAFLAKPITSLAVFQETILRLLPKDRQPGGLRIMTEDEVIPDRIAYRDDIAHIADVLDEPANERALDYVAQFLAGVARSANDPYLESAARALADKRAQGEPTVSETALIAGMLQERLSEKVAI